MNYAEDRLDRRGRHQSGIGFDPLSPPSVALSPLEEDLKEAYRLLQIGNATSKAKGHELAGRTLRDSGRNKQALFHYGQAWLLVHFLCESDKEGSASVNGNDKHNFNLSDEEK